ncbi:murein hydrolase activator EnvC family protein [Anaeromassilibacillus senegalensis]|uniref:murein hydrolase activator EnvC family protein n=1 Tax=Anaeromassilibacillus senegalensis TaxID=1673717 RepID=UPI0006814512|nr:M23 family metallopeptidase [Anaeromassilibacillus senegalensis]
MDKKRKARKAAAFLLAVLMLCSSASSGYLQRAYAVEGEDDLTSLQQQQEELQREREQLALQQQETNAKLEKLRADKAKKLEYKNTLDGQIENVQSQISVLNRQVETLDANIQDKTAQIADKQKSIDEQFEQLKKRLCAIYKTGEASTLQILLNADNVMDLANKSHLLRIITEHDTGLIEGLKEEMQGIAGEKAEIENNRKDVAAAKVELDRKRAELGVLQTEAQQVLNGLTAEEMGFEFESGDLEEQQRVLRQKENEAAEEIDRWWANYYAEQKRRQEELKRQQEEEERRRQEEEQRRQEEQNQNQEPESEPAPEPPQEPEQNQPEAPNVPDDAPLEYVGGAFAWPVPGFTHISDNYSSDHKAIDINRTNGVSIDGTPIVAANDGVVVKAESHYSYGNYVMIDHGGGYSTLYAHASRLAVSAGQQVKKGQTIAYVGSTGNSSGPHLHFEVRVDGVRQNPFNWFSAAN